MTIPSIQHYFIPRVVSLLLQGYFDPESESMSPPSLTTDICCYHVTSPFFKSPLSYRAIFRGMFTVASLHALSLWRFKSPLSYRAIFRGMFTVASLHALLLWRFLAVCTFTNRPDSRTPVSFYPYKLHSNCSAAQNSSRHYSISAFYPKSQILKLQSAWALSSSLK